MGHLAALLTIIFWSTTYASTVILLESFEPIEILFLRFLVAFLILEVIYPKRMKKLELKQELLFVLAGLAGICIYYMCQNVALTYTQSTNVGVEIAVAPLFTALIASFLLKEEKKPSRGFAIGAVFALAGVAMLTFSGQELQLNPIGDLLGILAAVAWAVYSTITNRISKLGFHVIQTTRRIFFWGLIWLIPMTIVFPIHMTAAEIFAPVNLFNTLYLGAGASAVCFVTWNYAVSKLGPTTTSTYIFVGPIITIITGVLILGEKLTLSSVLGSGLILIGMYLCQRKEKQPSEETNTDASI